MDMSALQTGDLRASLPQERDGGDNASVGFSSNARAIRLKLAGARVSGRAPRSTSQAAVCSGVTTFRSALRIVLRRCENAAATTAAKCGLTQNAGSRRMVRRTPADQTLGGGWKGPGPTSDQHSA